MPDSARHRLLILGGTGEALGLARAVAATLPDLPITTSLAGRTRDPVLPPGTLRVGGFGGTDGLVRYLDESAVTLLVNATHPYAAEMSAHALAAHRRTGIPLLRLLRPAWRRQRQDSWIKVPDTKAAADICRWLGHRVFLSIGRRELEAFAGLSRAHFVLRLVDPPEGKPPLEHYELIAARGPFTLRDERTMLLEKGIDLIVTKNSGGDATYAKIEAARELAIPVVMIERPAIAVDPGSDQVDSVEAALSWIAARLSERTAAPTAARNERA